MIILETKGDVARVHDVVMIKEGSTYYLFSTGKGLPLRRSQDMLLWEPAGRVFETLPDWVVQAVPGATSLWAPDVVRHGGKYYLYYAASTFGSRRSVIGMATNVTLDPENPAYRWVDEGPVTASQESYDYNAIDPQLCFDEGGQPWLAFGSFWSGIKLVELDRQTLKPAPGAGLLPIASNPGTGAVEGAYIVRRGDYYYLFISHDYCCRGALSDYKIKVGRARQITGPYRDREGRLLTEGGGTLIYAGSSRWRGPGHNSIYVEDGTYFLVYHSYDADAEGAPTLRIEQLGWDEEDWPVSPSASLGR